jgi:hypothetical protein
MVNFKHISFVFLGLAKVILSQNSCMRYECTNNILPDTFCMKRANATNVVDLEECRENNYCEYDKTNFDGICKNFSYLSKQFVKGPCNVDGDCRQGTCVSNVCTATITTCTNDYDCAIGDFCGKTGDVAACTPQLAVGATCTKTSECVNTAMCRSSNNVCTQVLTLNAGDVVAANEAFLCASGFALDGVCSVATLKTTGVCDGTCTYNNNGTDVNSTTSCLCGKNTNGDRYCNFGTNSPQLNNTLNLKRKYLNLNNTVLCHTSERFTPCMSQSFDRKEANTHNSFDFQKELKTFHNGLILNNVEFVGQTTDTCFLPVLGAYDRNMIKPVSTNQCPMFKCGTEKTFCSNSANPNNFDSSMISLTLNKVCNSTQSCPLPDYKQIYNKETVQTTCVDNNSGKSKFPGESCKRNEDCVNKNCTSNVCQYIELNGACSRADPIDLTKQCGVGAYCNATNFCNLQIKRDQACDNTFDCENDLVCFNKTCSMTYGSVKDGDLVQTDLLSKDFGNNYDYLCETMKFDTDTKKCYSYNYANSTSMVPNSAGFVACNRTDAGNECIYETSLDKKTMTRNCECGYNSNGQGYCPLDFSKGKFLKIL